MGTPGYIIITINNRNFVFYNHFDSYVEVLGLLLVENITRLLSENKLEEIKDSFRGIKEDDKQFLIDFKTREIIENLTLKREKKDIIEDLLQEIKDTYKNCYYSKEDYLYDNNIEYFYIIDFDKDTFSILSNDCILKNIRLSVEDLELMRKLVM